MYIAILSIEVVASTMMKLYIESYERWDSYLGPQHEINFSTLVKDILSFTILYNYIVPLSLYVTVGKTSLIAFFCTHNIHENLLLNVIVFLIKTVFRGHFISLYPIYLKTLFIFFLFIPFLFFFIYTFLIFLLFIPS